MCPALLEALGIQHEPSPYMTELKFEEKDSNQGIVKCEVVIHAIKKK